jgi:hypothetical protein
VAPELEALIWPLLSEDAGARGSAAKLAQAAERTAQPGGLEADGPILPIPAPAPTPSEEAPSRSDSYSSNSSRPPSRRSSTGSGRRAPPEGFPAWLSSGIAALVGSMLLGVCSDMRHREPAPQEDWRVAEWRPPPIEAPDAGVAESTLLSVEQTPRPTSAGNVLGLPMPKTPLPGQKRPPCLPEYEIAALGACWTVYEKKPPCGAAGHEYDGKCVRAVFDSPRPPTSGQP